MSDVWRIDKPTCTTCGGHGFHANPLANRDGYWSCIRCDGRSEGGAFVLQKRTACGVVVQLSGYTGRSAAAAGLQARALGARLAGRRAGGRLRVMLAGLDRRYVAVEVVYSRRDETPADRAAADYRHGLVVLTVPVADLPEPAPAALAAAA